MWSVYLVMTTALLMVNLRSPLPTVEALASRSERNRTIIQRQAAPSCHSCTHNGNWFPNFEEMESKMLEMERDSYPKDNIHILQSSAAQYIAKVSPYLTGPAVNPKQAINRSSIWIETGFRGTDYMSAHVAMNIMEKLALHCKENCLYDYYIVPLVNGPGYNSVVEKGNTHYIYSLENNGGPTNDCQGFDLLRHFPGKENDWEKTDFPFCSGQIKPMESDRLFYVPYVKAQDKANIALNIVISQDAELKGRAASLRMPWLGWDKDSYPKPTATIDYLKIHAEYEKKLGQKEYLDQRKIGFHEDGEYGEFYKGHPTNYYAEVYPDALSYNIALDGRSKYVESETYIEENTNIVMDIINEAINESEGTVFKVVYK